MKFPPRRLATRSSGFVISLEFLLVVALVVIPLMIGMILLGRKVITLYLNQVAMMEQPLARPVVWDSTGKSVGPVIGYDALSAPTVLFRDRTGVTFGGSEFTPGVLLGVRPNRFTTISRTYYDGAGCTGTPYVKSAASISAWPNVGFISQTQGINYAVGAGNVLYREANLGTAGANVVIASYWVSQDVGDAGPAATPSTACVEITGAGLTVDSLDDSGTGATVTAVTTVVHSFSAGDSVTIAGNPTYNGLYQVTSASGRHFTFTGPGALGASPGGTATRSTTVPNLVATTLVADLDSGNFTPPYRVAFPTTVPAAPLVSTGG